MGPPTGLARAALECQRNHFAIFHIERNRGGRHFNRSECNLIYCVKGELKAGTPTCQLSIHYIKLNFEAVTRICAGVTSESFRIDLKIGFGQRNGSGLAQQFGDLRMFIRRGLRERHRQGRRLDAALCQSDLHHFDISFVDGACQHVFRAAPRALCQQQFEYLDTLFLGGPGERRGTVKRVLNIHVGTALQ